MGQREADEGFETSKLTLSGTPPPFNKATPSNLPSTSTNWGPNTQTYGSLVTSLIQTTTAN